MKKVRSLVEKFVALKDHFKLLKLLEKKFTQSKESVKEKSIKKDIQETLLQTTDLIRELNEILDSMRKKLKIKQRERKDMRLEDAELRIINVVIESFR